MLYNLNVESFHKDGLQGVASSSIITSAFVMQPIAWAKIKRKTSLFPVACARCILAIKFARSLFILTMCVSKNNYNWKGQHECQNKKKNSYKLIFWPRHAKGISYVYVVTQTFEYVFNLFVT